LDVDVPFEEDIYGASLLAMAFKDMTKSSIVGLASCNSAGPFS
jgi:hypothetical protein